MLLALKREPQSLFSIFYLTYFGFGLNVSGHGIPTMRQVQEVVLTGKGKGMHIARRKNGIWDKEWVCSPFRLETFVFKLSPCIPLTGRLLQVILITKLFSQEVNALVEQCIQKYLGLPHVAGKSTQKGQKFVEQIYFGWGKTSLAFLWHWVRFVFFLLQNDNASIKKCLSPLWCGRTAPISEPQPHPEPLEESEQVQHLGPDV